MLYLKGNKAIPHPFYKIAAKHVRHHAGRPPAPTNTSRMAWSENFLLGQDINLNSEEQAEWLECLDNV